MEKSRIHVHVFDDPVLRAAEKLHGWDTSTVEVKNTFPNYSSNVV